METTDIRTFFTSNKAWVQTLLEELLRIPSESGNEQAAIEYLHSRMSSIGAISTLVPTSDRILSHPEYSDPVKRVFYAGRSNLCLTVPGRNDKTIAFNSHIDVVPPSAGQTNPYLPHIDAKNRMFARGACDAKGQIAAMALLIKAACELGPLKNGIVCHIVIEEELGGNGTLAMLEAAPSFHADALINMEPTDLQLMTSIRGAVWFEIQFSGVARHAGSAGATKSVIDKAIAAITLLKQYHAELYRKSSDYGLFKNIENPMPLIIGEFQAGVWPSMIPGSARISGLTGILPNTTKQQVMAEIEHLFNRDENRWLKEGMTIHFPYRHNAVELPVDHYFARDMANAMQQCGLNATPRAMTASTDAIFYHERGIPSLAFGPGKLSDAHSSNECIAIDDIVKAAEVIYRFVGQTNGE